jgi:inorganic pyrophosphatase
VIEIPRGTSAKYEYDKDLEMFRLDRCLQSAMMYPANYGFIPNTLADDGDPLDVLIFNRTPIDRGTLVECKTIGVLNMTDEGCKDYKILAVPTAHYRKYNTLNDIEDLFLDVTKNFFEHYKDLNDKNVWVGKWHGKQRAKDIIVKDTI